MSGDTQLGSLDYLHTYIHIILSTTYHHHMVMYYHLFYPSRTGDLRVIRPLVYVREKQLREFAETRHLPVIPENCPACFEVPKVRGLGRLAGLR